MDRKALQRTPAILPKGGFAKPLVLLLGKPVLAPLVEQFFENVAGRREVP